MFKLLRDSMFDPKKIIYYRAKKTWFVVLYVIIVSMIAGIGALIEPLSYKTISDYQKSQIVRMFEGTGAKIENGKYSSNTDIVIDMGGITIGFYNSSKTMAETNTYPLIVVIGEEVDFVLSSSASTTPQLYKLTTLVDLSPKLENIDLGNMTVDSEFFEAANSILSSIIPWICVLSFIGGMISGTISMLSLAFITYLFMLIFVKAGSYMKKGQLYKMLVFASTSIVIMEAIIEMFNVPTIVSFILLFISFIPLSILEREIVNRIKIKIFGESVGNNESIINKFNELINKAKESDDDEDSDSNEEEDD